MNNNQYHLRLNRRSTLVSLGAVILLTLLAAMRDVFSVDYIAALVFVLYMTYVVTHCKTYFIKYSRVIVMDAYHLLSVLIVNNRRTFFFNLWEYSSNNGSFIPLLIVYTFQFGTMFILETNRRSRLLKKIDSLPDNVSTAHTSHIQKHWVHFMSWVIMLVMAYMLFRVAGNSYFSMSGTDRFAYRAAVFTPLDEKLYNYIIWFLPIPLLSKNLGYNFRGNLFLCMLCIYLIGVGDKFSSLFTVLFIYLLVCWAVKHIDRKLLMRAMLLVGGILMVLLVYIGYQVLFERGGGTEMIVTYFDNRITGGQSDLWWKIYGTTRYSTAHFTEFGDELKAIFTQPSSALDYNFGIYKMMRIAAPWSIVKSYLIRGVRFAASSQASVYYYFKMPGLLVYGAFSGWLMFFVINHAVYAYKSLNMIQAVCYTMIIQKMFMLLSMSEITVLGHGTLWLAILVLLYYRFTNRQVYPSHMESDA